VLLSMVFVSIFVFARFLVSLVFVRNGVLVRRIGGAGVIPWVTVVPGIRCSSSLLIQALSCDGYLKFKIFAKN